MEQPDPSPDADPSNHSVFAVFERAAIAHAERPFLIVDGEPLLTDGGMLDQTARAAGVTADELPAGASGLRIVAKLNGEILQDGITADTIFDVATLVATLSEATIGKIYVVTQGELTVVQDDEVRHRLGQCDSICLVRPLQRKPNQPRIWCRARMMRLPRPGSGSGSTVSRARSARMADIGAISGTPSAVGATVSADSSGTWSVETGGSPW